MSDLTFGECEGLCGGMVERVGWDRYCFNCQDEMAEEQEERWAAMDEEDHYLYGIAGKNPGSHRLASPIRSRDGNP